MAKKRNQDWGEPVSVLETDQAATPPETPAPPADEPEDSAPEPEIQKATTTEVVEELPTTLKECIALVHQYSKLPTRTPEELRAKMAKLKPAQKRMHEIQQGLPVLEIGAHGYGESAHAHAPALKRERYAAIARQHPEVNELLAELDAAKKEIEALKKIVS